MAHSLAGVRAFYTWPPLNFPFYITSLPYLSSFCLMIPHTWRRLSSDPCGLQTCKSSCVHHLHPPSSGCKHHWAWPEGCELATSILTPPWIDKGQMIPSTGIDAVGHQPLCSLFKPLHLFDCLCGLKRQRVMSLLIKSFLASSFVFFWPLSINWWSAVVDGEP